jgi:hypothetical protein
MPEISYTRIYVRRFTGRRAYCRESFRYAKPLSLITNTDSLAEQPLPNDPCTTDQPIDLDWRHGDADQCQISDKVEQPKKRKRGTTQSQEAIPGTTGVDTGKLLAVEAVSLSLSKENRGEEKF